MRLSFLLVTLFVSAVAREATTTTTIDATTAIEIENSNTNSDTTIIDMDHQERRKTWDVFGLLLMSTLYTSIVLRCSILSKFV